MNATSFLIYWYLAFAVLAPVMWWAIAHDMNRTTEWSRVSKRLLLGFVLAVSTGSVLYAAEVPTPSAADCAAWGQTAWTTITYWWWLAAC